jgi:hypothetical protein
MHLQQIAAFALVALAATYIVVTKVRALRGDRSGGDCASGCGKCSANPAKRRDGLIRLQDIRSRKPGQ